MQDLSEYTLTQTALQFVPDSDCSKVTPPELKEKLESAAKDLDKSLSHFLRKRGETVV